MREDRRRKAFADEKGSSMVSVIVAFVILMIGMGMVYTSIMFNKNLTARAADTRRKTEDTVASYYQGTGTAATQKVTLTLQDESGKSIRTSGNYIAYTAENGEMIYSFSASPGDGWHAADHTMGEYEFKLGTSGGQLNTAIRDANGGTFPPVSDEEWAAAQNAVNLYYHDQNPIPNVPSGLVWKANTCSDPTVSAKKGYFLWATTNTESTEGWSAVLLCIDGKMFVSTNPNGGKDSISEIGIAALHSYTKVEMLAALAGDESIPKLYNILKNFTSIP